MPSESFDSHDADEMDMSSDDESFVPSLRYGKRTRSDTKVRTKLNNLPTTTWLM